MPSPFTRKVKVNLEIFVSRVTEQIYTKLGKKHFMGKSWSTERKLTATIVKIPLQLFKNLSGSIDSNLFKEKNILKWQDSNMFKVK